ncbi:MAG: hypothetical protein HRT68_07445 [Flavobacteriaceae bacterium]|nr:hypothetical protein [Flavobacteriaceae bacterium]
MLIEESILDRLPSSPDRMRTTWVAYCTFYDKEKFNSLLMSTTVMSELTNASLPHYDRVLNREHESWLSNFSIHYNDNTYPFYFKKTKRIIGLFKTKNSPLLLTTTTI